MKSAKKIFSLSLVLILLLHINYVGFYYSLYSINTEGLTESCCKKIVENCNAHCFLDEKVDEGSKEDQKSTSVETKLKISEFEVEYIDQIFPRENLNQYVIINPGEETSDFVHTIDHPPQL